MKTTFIALSILSIALSACGDSGSGSGKRSILNTGTPSGLDGNWLGSSAACIGTTEAQIMSRPDASTTFNVQGNNVSDLYQGCQASGTISAKSSNSITYSITADQCNLYGAGATLTFSYTVTSKVLKLSDNFGNCTAYFKR